MLISFTNGFSQICDKLFIHLASHPAGNYPDSWSAGGSMGGCEVWRAGSRLGYFFSSLSSFSLLLPQGFLRFCSQASRRRVLCESSLRYCSNDVILLSDTVVMIWSSVSLSWLLFLLRTLWCVSGRLGRNYDRWRNGCTITVYFTDFCDLL